MELSFYVGADSRYTEEAHCALKTKKRFFPEVDCFSFSQRPQLKGRLTTSCLNVESQAYTLLNSKTLGRVIVVSLVCGSDARLDLACVVCCGSVVLCWIG